jgi:hypothetical protein
VLAEVGLVRDVRIEEVSLDGQNRIPTGDEALAEHREQG